MSPETKVLIVTLHIAVNKLLDMQRDPITGKVPMHVLNRLPSNIERIATTPVFDYLAAIDARE